MLNSNKSQIQYSADLLSQIQDLKQDENSSTQNWHDWLTSIDRTDLESRLDSKNPMSYSSAEYMLPGMAAEGGLGALSRDHFLQAVRLGIPSLFFGLLYFEQKIQTIQTDGKGRYWQEIHMENLPTPEDLHFRKVDNLSVKIRGEHGLQKIPVFKYPLSSNRTPLYVFPMTGGVYPNENNSNERLWNNVVLGVGQHQIQTN
jgi:glucan phosphorylase